MDTCDVQCTIFVCELYGRFQTFRNSLFSATSILLSDGEERDQRGEPYSERQYDFIRKHLTKRSSEENLHKTELALLCDDFVMTGSS